MHRAARNRLGTIVVLAAASAVAATSAPSPAAPTLPSLPEGDDECTATGGDGEHCAVSALQMRGARKASENYKPPVIHYRAGRPDAKDMLANGVWLERWHSPSVYRHTDNIFPTDLTSKPPHVARMVLRAGQRFPPRGGSVALDQHVMYVVAHGALRCESCKGKREVLKKGELFFSPPGASHGPFVNVGKGEAILLAATAGKFAYRNAKSASGSGYTLGQRVLRINGWGPSGLGPNVETQRCWKSGNIGVTNQPEIGPMPNIMSVMMHSDCMIPCHEHLGGATYFIIEGELLVKGDGGPHYNKTYRAGDTRWVNSGHIYGPEFTKIGGNVRLVVLGLPGLVTPGQCQG